MLDWSHSSLTDKSRGADKLLSLYHQIQQEIICLATTTPDKLLIKLNQLIPHDAACRFRMGQGTADGKRSLYLCSSCRALARLNKKNESSFLLQVGQQCGKRLRIETYERLWQPHLELWPVPGDSHCLVIISGPLFHHYLLSLLAREALGGKHIVRLYHAFLCANTTYMISEETSTAVTAAHFPQLVVMLSQAAEVNFLHGQISPSVFRVTSDAVSYRYQGITVEGSSSLKLTALEQSSLGWKGYIYLPSTAVRAPSFLGQYRILEDETGKYLVIDGDVQETFHALRHQGQFAWCAVLESYLFLLAFQSLLPDFSLPAGIWSGETPRSVSQLRGQPLRADILPVLRLSITK